MELESKPCSYSDEYVEQLQAELQQTRSDVEWLKSRCCHWWNIFKTDEPIPMLNWVINKTPVIIWAIDENGKILLSEGKSLVSLDLKPGEVVGESVFDVFADYPSILAAIRRVLMGEPITTEVSINGCYFEVEHTPITDSSGEVCGAVCVSLEVTRRRRAEQALSQNETYYQEVFEALPIAVVTTTPQREIIKMNQAAEALFGYKNDEVVGSLTEIFYDNKKAFMDLGQRYSETNNILKVNLPLHKSDGSSFISESVCLKSIDRNGSVSGLISIHRDITEEKKAAELAHWHEKTLQIMIDAAPVKALMLDSDFCVQFANQHFAEHIGIPLSKLVGAYTPKLVENCPLSPHRLKNVQTVLDTGVPLSFTDNENGRWYEHHLAPLELAVSQKKCVAIFLHDITERIQQEEQERERIVEELHEVVSDMLEGKFDGHTPLKDELRDKPLSPREKEVLREIASGLTTKQIASKYSVSTKTVESQRLSIMRKLRLFTVAELTKYAIRKKFVGLET